MRYRTHRSVGYCSTKVTELAEVSGYCIQNQRVISVEYRMCYITHRSVGCLWHDRHRTHRSLGYLWRYDHRTHRSLLLGKPEGNYPRDKSVCTLQDLPLKYYISCKNYTSYERTFWCDAAVKPSSTPHVLHKQERTRGRAQGPPTQRHVTTTASCRSRNWPVVRASVGLSKVVRSTAVDRRKTT